MSYDLLAAPESIIHVLLDISAAEFKALPPLPLVAIKAEDFAATSSCPVFVSTAVAAEVLFECLFRESRL